MIAVLFATGFEEVEAIAPVDVLRRAGCKVVLAGVDGPVVTGSHGVSVQMDCRIDDILDAKDLEAVVLPGGLPGTTNLEASPQVQALLDACRESGKLIGAICAAPSILAHKGFLKGVEATSFPSFQKDLEEGGARLSEDYVVRDGQFITGRGMGVATDFGLALAEALVSREAAEKIRGSIQQHRA